MWPCSVIVLGVAQFEMEVVVGEVRGGGGMVRGAVSLCGF